MRYDPTTTTPAKGAAGDIAKGSMELKSERNVNVRTHASVVTLSGQVPTFGAGAQDSEMARGVSGVKRSDGERARISSRAPFPQ